MSPDMSSAESPSKYMDTIRNYQPRSTSSLEAILNYKEARIPGNASENETTPSLGLPCAARPIVALAHSTAHSQHVQHGDGNGIEECCYDVNNISEMDFQDLCIYIVPDRPTADVCRNKAEASLPRNLILKPSQALGDALGVWSIEYIPRGTRFGPLIGEIYTKDTVPKMTTRKYFWRVFDSVIHYTYP